MSETKPGAGNDMSQPGAEPQPEGEQSRAPPPQPRKRRRRAPKGRKKQKLSRGEEHTIEQGAVPESTEVRTEGRNESVLGATTFNQGTQFTDISQTLMTMQRAQEAQMDRLNEARLRERALELEHKREVEERRLKIEEDREKRRMEWEQEQQRENRAFQLQLQVNFTNLIGTLVKQLPLLSQPAAPSRPQDPQNTPSQPSSSTNPPP